MVSMVSKNTHQAGFTLTEMLLALAILTFGLTALAGSLTMGVGTRRNTEMRLRVVDVLPQVLFDLQENYFMEHADAEVLPAVERRPLPNDPSIQYSVKFSAEPEQADLLLARIQVSWSDQGQDVAESFDRILVRSLPFSQRVSRAKEQQSSEKKQ